MELENLHIFKPKNKKINSPIVTIFGILVKTILIKLLKLIIREVIELRCKDTRILPKVTSLTTFAENNLASSDDMLVLSYNESKSRDGPSIVRYGVFVCVGVICEMRDRNCQMRNWGLIMLIKILSKV